MNTTEKEQYFKSARRNLLDELDITNGRTSDMFDKSIITHQVPSLAAAAIQASKSTSPSLFLRANNAAKSVSSGKPPGTSSENDARNTKSSAGGSRQKQVPPRPSSSHRTATNTVARMPVNAGAAIRKSSSSSSLVGSSKQSVGGSSCAGSETLEMFDPEEVKPQFTEDPTMNIFLRIRPFALIERRKGEDQASICVFREDPKFLEVVPPKTSNAHRNCVQTAGQQKSLYGFTHVFGPEEKQFEFFEKTVVPSLQQFVAEGRNQLLFTYGVTGSGKTYTLLGTPKELGILPRAIDIIFNSIKANVREEEALDKHKYFVKPVNFDNCEPIEELSVRQEYLQLRNTLVDAMKPRVRDVAAAPSSKISTSSTITTTTSSSLSMAPSDSCADIFGYFNDRAHDKHALPVAGPKPSLDIDSAITPSGATISNISKTTRIQIWVSFVEIYNDIVHDLLVGTELRGKARALIVAQDQRVTYLKCATEVPVYSPKEAYAVLGYGQRNLHYAHTKLNRQSSRSHCIFTVKLVRMNKVNKTHDDGHREVYFAATVSVYSFCDLAGSERFKKTQASGLRMKEGQSINRDLHFLHDVITILRNNQKLQEMHPNKKPKGLEVVPYRNCKLTRLFQNFFTGVGRATMIVNVSPCASVHDETLHALRFASIAKQVVTSDVKDERTSELLYDDDENEEDELFANGDSAGPMMPEDNNTAADENRKRVVPDATTVVKKKPNANGTPGKSILSKRTQRGISPSKTNNKTPGTVTRAGTARHVQLQMEYNSPTAAPSDMANVIANENGKPSAVRYAWMHSDSDDDDDDESGPSATSRKTSLAKYPWMRSKRALHGDSGSGDGSNDTDAATSAEPTSCATSPEQTVAESNNKRQRIVTVHDVDADAAIAGPSTAVRQSMGGTYAPCSQDVEWQRNCPFPEYIAESDPKVRGLLHVVKQLQDALRAEYSGRVMLEARVRRELVEYYEKKIDDLTTSYDKKLEDLRDKCDEQSERDVEKTRLYALEYAQNQYAAELEDHEFERAEMEAERMATAVKTKPTSSVPPVIADADVSEMYDGFSSSADDDVLVEEGEEAEEDSTPSSGVNNNNPGFVHGEPSSSSSAVTPPAHHDTQQRKINRLADLIDENDADLDALRERFDRGDPSVTEENMRRVEEQLEELKNKLVRLQAGVSRRSTMYIQTLARTAYHQR